MAESLTLKNLAEEKCPWWQYVGLRCVGKTAARKCRGRAVRAWHFLACEDNWLLCYCLRAGRMNRGGKYKTCTCDQRDGPSNLHKTWCSTHSAADHYKTVIIGKTNLDQ